MENNVTLQHQFDKDAITIEEVKDFLDQFNAKMKIWGILYMDDRVKNVEAIQELAIVPSYRRIVIESLVEEDYVQGPIIDLLNEQGEMWVFGKNVKDQEVYIKISIGYQNSQTICISFHIAEHPLKYPFKVINNEKLE